MPSAVVAVVMGLLALAAVPLQLDVDRNDGEWVVYRVISGSTEPRFAVEATSDGHGYVTLLRRNGQTGWLAPVTGSTTDRVVVASSGEPVHASVGVGDGPQTTTTGAGLSRSTEYLFVVLVYGDVVRWNLSLNDVLVEELDRGFTVRAYWASDLHGGPAARIESSATGIDVMAPIRMDATLEHPGFGLFGAADLLATEGGLNTSRLWVESNVAREECPCQFFGDETRPDLSVMNMVALVPGGYTFHAEGIRPQSLTSHPILVYAEIPDPT